MSVRHMLVGHGQFAINGSQCAHTRRDAHAWQTGIWRTGYDEPAYGETVYGETYSPVVELKRFFHLKQVFYHFSNMPCKSSLSKAHFFTLFSVVYRGRNSKSGCRDRVPA